MVIPTMLLNSKLTPLISRRIAATGQEGQQGVHQCPADEEIGVDHPVADDGIDVGNREDPDIGARAITSGISKKC